VSGYAFACRVADLADETAIGVEIDGVPVCVAKSDGEIFAISDICSHADIPLSEGDVGDSRFDLRSGQPTGLPANQPVPTYPVKIDGDDVLVAVKE